ncbi:hypothetical protein DEH69_19155 [Streptomyces sp. PT12]|nr:hypothetical protein DEH69_19155 [Streptomyces sp. PT12]
MQPRERPRLAQPRQLPCPARQERGEPIAHRPRAAGPPGPPGPPGQLGQRGLGPGRGALEPHIYTGEPGSPSEEALRLLASWAATQDPERSG